jgi:hypothetical protein
MTTPTHVVPKSWGEEHWIVNGEYCGKKLVLKKGHRCSLHYHKVKDSTTCASSIRAASPPDGTSQS